MRIVRDILIISALAAYFMYELSAVIEPEVVGWFSDRDSILNYKVGKFKQPIIFDFANTYFHVFKATNSIGAGAKAVFGNPDQKGFLFYDSFNRIPDMVCGTIADYNFEKGYFSRNKFIQVKLNLLSSSSKSLIFKIDFPADVDSCIARVEFKK